MRPLVARLRKTSLTQYEPPRSPQTMTMQEPACRPVTKAIGLVMARTLLEDLASPVVTPGLKRSVRSRIARTLSRYPGYEELHAIVQRSMNIDLAHLEALQDETKPEL